MKIKKIKLNLWVLIVLIMIGCKKDPDPEPFPAVITPELAVTKVMVKVYEVVDITITKGKSPFRVTVANSLLATAYIDGSHVVIEGRAIGTTTFTVKGSDGGTTAAIPLTVTAADPPADPYAAFKENATLRIENGLKVRNNLNSDSVFYRDQGKLFSSEKVKIGWATSDGISYELIEFTGTPAVGVPTGATIRNQSGVITPHTIEILKVAEGKVWIVFKKTSGSAEEKWVQYW
jgi:hypothetical protein